jgi:hypothetical protein
MSGTQEQSICAGAFLQGNAIYTWRREGNLSQTHEHSPVRHGPFPFELRFRSSFPPQLTAHTQSILNVY